MSNIGTKFNLANKFIFDPNTNSLVDSLNGNEMIRMGSNESRILLFLSENPNQVVSRNQLYDFVWREQGFEVDDSSLTQAISTLRKQLNDSTKSPEFVKTVPKRGYQLICSVERTTPITSGDDSVNLSSSSEIVEDKTPQEPEVHLIPEVEREIEVVEPSHTETPPAAKTKQPLSLLAKLALAFALILPLLALSIDKPTESHFRQLATFSDVTVKTPINHPDLTQWLPAIEQCVVRYKNNHVGESAPVEVIATGGQNSQLVLNYIHQLNYSGENITVRIFADQENINHICQ
ncbi:transcriptional regulator [Vibrio panuliri]|uniref:Transcriptional regulator n=1 Tax=Vibrio panuliri TaxID=1381081 RepID=A0A1Q9HMJ1_9VIBR|nr:transcriptional regulator [Vibrio panuliri]OLQ91931.1 transcriptional regulator [Vibrio panuliri]